MPTSDAFQAAHKQMALDNLRRAMRVVVSAMKAMYTQSAYKDGIYAAAQGYWKEGLRGNFVSRMNMTIKFGLQSAFEQGADDVGVSPDEFEQADKDLIASIIDEEKSHVADLLTFLDGLANDRNAKLSDADYRLNMWANRFQDVLSQARVNFGGKQRMEWKLGEAEKHCHTGDNDKPGIGCANLSGIVLFAAEWDKLGIKPQSRQTNCQGYNCTCEIVPTDRRRTRNGMYIVSNMLAEANL